MSFQRIIQNGIYFQYTLYTLKLVVDNSVLQLIHFSDWFVDKSKQLANLVCKFLPTSQNIVVSTCVRFFVNSLFMAHVYGNTPLSLSFSLSRALANTQITEIKHKSYVTRIQKTKCVCILFLRL